MGQEEMAKIAEAVNILESSASWVDEQTTL